MVSLVLTRTEWSGTEATTTLRPADGKLHNVNICGAKRTYTRVRVGTGRGAYNYMQLHC